MANCHACVAEMSDQDRFCRQCGAPVATLVGDLVDTYRFKPDASPAATAQRSSGVLTNPFYAAPPSANAIEQGSNPLYHTASVKRRLIRRRFIWLMAILMLLILTAGGIAFVVHERRVDRAEEAVREVEARRDFEKVVQNALGFRLGRVSDAGYTEVKGIFVDSLTSDDSPAALAQIQAGDVIMELNGQVVRNSSELQQVLDSLSPGMEVAAKLFRDGETLSVRIKVADPTLTPFEPKVQPREQGFLGVWGNRGRIPSTRKWGVEIYRPVDNSPADIAGLQAGDFITEFDSRAIRTSGELSRRIRAAKPRSKVQVKFYRGSTEQTVEIILGHQWENRWE